MDADSKEQTGDEALLLASLDFLRSPAKEKTADAELALFSSQHALLARSEAGADAQVRAPQVEGCAVQVSGEADEQARTNCEMDAQLLACMAALFGREEDGDDVAHVAEMARLLDSKEVYYDWLAHYLDKWTKVNYIFRVFAKFSSKKRFTKKFFLVVTN